MSYLSKLNAKTGGGLGGIPESKNNFDFRYKFINQTQILIPDGVDTISIVCTGGGGGGGTWNGGGGGAGLSCLNNLKVKSNDILSCSIGSGGTAYGSTGGNGGSTLVYLNGVLILSAGGGAGGTINAGGGGGAGNLSNGSPGNTINGGVGGGYYGPGNNAGIAGTHVLYGSAGGHAGDTSESGAGVTAGSPGGCHVIFGKNRSYPNNHCHNFFD